MRSLNRGLILIAACGAVIIGSGIGLYREMTGLIQKSDNDAIGKIVFKKKTAVRKYAEFVIWEELENSSPVFNYDSIRTYPASAAYIRLNNGAEISLDESTMIVLVIDDRGVKINFDQGSVSARTTGAGEAGAISFNTKDASISMDKGELSVRKDSNAMNVNVFSGDALVNTGGDLKKIDSTSGVLISDGKTEVKKISVFTLNPDNNTVFVTNALAASVDFTWKSDHAGKSLLEVSGDPGFRDTVVRVQVNGSRYIAKLTPGDYYWRVSSGSGISAIKKFTLLRDSAFQYQYPGRDEKVLVSLKDPVRFRWSSSEFAQGFIFELASDQGMSNILNNSQLQVNSFSLNELQSGTFWWRIKRIYPPGFIMLDPENLPVKFSLERSAVVRARPKPFSRSMFASTLSESILFSWEGSAGANSYVVEISDDTEFQKLTSSGRTGTTVYRSEVPPEGNYYCRIRADYGNNEYETSEIILLKVGKPEPVIYVSPLMDEVIENSAVEIRFSWKDNFNSGNYIFDLASDEKFSGLLASGNTTSGEYRVRVPGQGRFFWRVSIADKAGKVIVKGNTGMFIIPSALEKPVTIYPENLSTVNLDDINVLRFQWSGVKGADSYELEVFHREAGADRSLITMSTNSTQVEVRNFSLLEKGTIVWVVRARKKSGKKVTATSESDRRYFVIDVSENMRAPKIKSRDTIYVH